jgi:hypothetical protein
MSIQDAEARSLRFRIREIRSKILGHNRRSALLAKLTMAYMLDAQVARRKTRRGDPTLRDVWPRSLPWPPGLDGSVPAFVGLGRLMNAAVLDELPPIDVPRY